VIVDTNVAIDFINGPAGAAARFSQPATLFVPTVVLGELFFGAENSTQVAVNLQNVERFAGSAKVLPVDIDVARRYGQLWRKLVKKGKPIPDSDAWIAATALTHQLPLVTRDKHFQEVEGLNVLEW
jgi:tRNA(fMet)-specific endonuclease VapC